VHAAHILRAHGSVRASAERKKEKKRNESLSLISLSAASSRLVSDGGAVNQPHGGI